MCVFPKRKREKLGKKHKGSSWLRLGLNRIHLQVPAELSQLECAWVLDGSTVLHNNQLTREGYVFCSPPPLLKEDKFS